MTRIEIDALRLRCRTALDAYKTRAAHVLEHSKGGDAPPAAELHAEELALYEYAKLRREFLDALGSIYRLAH